MLHLRNFLVAGLLAATTLFASPTTTSATILPLSACGPANCDWSAFPLTADPITGDIWVKFESAPGAGDKAHIVGENTIWQVFLGQEIGIHLVFNEPFLTDMDQPITNLNFLVYPVPADTLNFDVGFSDPVFVHDMHWPCAGNVDACLAAVAGFTQGLSFISDDPFVTGIWVPEPGTLGLFAVGLAGLAFARRRRSA